MNCVLGHRVPQIPKISISFLAVSRRKCFPGQDLVLYLDLERGREKGGPGREMGWIRGGGVNNTAIISPKLPKIDTKIAYFRKRSRSNFLLGSFVYVNCLSHGDTKSEVF